MISAVRTILYLGELLLSEKKDRKMAVTSTCKVVPTHVIKAYRRIEVQLHSFLNLALDGGEW